MRSDRDYLEVFKIRRDAIVEAVKEMNSSSDWHKPRVVGVQLMEPEGYFLVTVEHSGYPFRERQWREWYGIENIAE